jgi:hypothetical protein
VTPPEHAMSVRVAWLRTLRRYLCFLTLTSLVWETLQLPLYTIARTASASEIAFAVGHCTVGDLIIAAVSLLLSLSLFGEPEWPARSYIRVAIPAITMGVGYTVFSEWLNVEVRRSWAYTDLMPLLPPLGTGLSPVVQWIVLPGAALVWARNIGRSNLDDKRKSERRT